MKELAGLLPQLEQQHGLPAGLLQAVMMTESGGNPRAVSPRGASGPFQFMPATAREYGIDPFNPQQSAQAAAKKLAELTKMYGGDTTKALQAYNWGEGNMASGKPMPAETQAYAGKVFSRMPKDKIDPAKVKWDDDAIDPAKVQWDDAPAQPAAKTRGMAQNTGDTLAGLVRGAGSIGATLLAPVDMAVRSLNNGKPLNIGGIDIAGHDRRAGMDSALGMLGANTQSLPFQAGKLTSEVAGTMGVGGVLGNAARAAGASPAVVSALNTAGFRTGLAPTTVAGQAGSLALRTGAGAATGAAGAAMVNPEDAGTGAAIGAVLPGALQGLAATGRGAANALKSGKTRATERLANALGPDAVRQASALAAARELVPGSQPTVAQVLRTPQAGILERVVSDSAGGVALKERYAAQNAARLAALDRVAPTDPRGFASARADLGAELERAMLPLREAQNARVSGLFESVDPDGLVRMRLPLDDMQGAADKFLGPGTVGQGGKAGQVLQEARRIGLESADGIAPTVAGPGPRTLAQEVRRAGGLSMGQNSGVLSEVKALGKDVKNLTRRGSAGLSPAKMAEKLHEKGILPDEDVNTLLNALRDEASGGPAVGYGDEAYGQFAAAREAAMGDVPVAGDIPRAVTWREAQNLRSSINDLWADASSKGRNREAAALQKMRDAIDNATEDVASGKLQPDEVFPDDTASRWRSALDEFQKFKQRFDTGPQAAMFRRGADGQPLAQGGEIAGRFWGAGGAAKENVESFRRLVADNPKLLGQFRAMVTTEGAATGGANEQLGAKFVRWVDQTLPGLKAAFDPAEVRQLQRIAADVKRSGQAASAGMSRGSNTYQNASNALSLGVLDSPLLNAAANRIPMVNGVTGPALQWMREGQREAMARELAGLLADPAAASNALLQLGAPRPSRVNALLPYAGRIAPALAAD
jgi:hypothetical protein